MIEVRGFNPRRQSLFFGIILMLSCIYSCDPVGECIDGATYSNVQVQSLEVKGFVGNDAGREVFEEIDAILKSGRRFMMGVYVNEPSVGVDEMIRGDGIVVVEPTDAKSIFGERDDWEFAIDRNTNFGGA